MKRQVYQILLPIICSVLLLSAFAWQGRTGARTNWDHKVLVLPTGTTHMEAEKKLVELGYLGWELVQVIPGESTGGNAYYLKRVR